MRTAHIRVEAELVSRQHAKLTLNFDNAIIEDLGSSNGTFVNDQPVTERTQLWPGQKIRIGAATVTLRRVQGEAPEYRSLAPAQQALRRMLPAEMLREKKYDIGAVVARRHGRDPRCARGGHRAQGGDEGHARHE